MTLSFLLVSLLVPARVSAQAGPPVQFLVKQVIENELKADDDDHSQWMYWSRRQEKNKTETRLVIESKDGDISELVSVNGAQLSAKERQQEEERLAHLVHDSDALQDERKKGEEDDRKARELMQEIHQAFLFRYVGRQGRNIRLAFRPNPQFQPATREAEVLHSMAGTMLVDAKEKRLVALHGHMIEDVDFGFGLLGHLDKGGSFALQRQEEAPGHWKTTLIDVHLKGKALLFKNISEQQHELRWQFREVPEGCTAPQAVQLLNHGAQVAVLLKPRTSK